MKTFISRKIKSYSALTAASLGSISLSQASVVYTDINPDTTFSGQFPSEIYDLDLDNDGNIDLSFTNYATSNALSTLYYGYNKIANNNIRGVFAAAKYGNGIMASSIPSSSSSSQAIALNYGNQIGSTANFWAGGTSAYLLMKVTRSSYYFWSHPVYYANSVYSYSRGNFSHNIDQYVGIKFKIGSNDHYGWVRVNIDTIAPHIIIKDYAYESCVNQPINAGVTSGGGLNSMSSVSISACDSLYFGNQWYFSNTTAVDTLIGGAANNCDSIVTANISIKNSPLPFNQSMTSCDSAVIFGRTYFNSQIVRDTLVAAAASGCDSTVVTTLTITSSSIQNINTTACDSAFISGNWITNSTVLKDTLLGAAANGCDSITINNVSINQSQYSIITIAACDSVLHQGNTFLADSVYNDTLIAASSDGCDSIITYDIDVHHNQTFKQNIHTCDNIVLYSQYYDSTQVINDTISGASSNGCDSIIITNLTVGYTSFGSSLLSINQGDSVFVGGYYQKTSGAYVDTLISNSGCDSLHTTWLSIISGIDSKIESGIQIRPNPVKNKLFIKDEKGQLAQVELLDIRGKRIIDVKPSSTSSEMINISHIDDGIYFVRIRFHTGDHKIYKIVKQ